MRLDRLLYFARISLGLIRKAAKLVTLHDKAGVTLAPEVFPVGKNYKERPSIAKKASNVITAQIN